MSVGQSGSVVFVIVVVVVDGGVVVVFVIVVVIYRHLGHRYYLLTHLPTCTRNHNNNNKWSLARRIIPHAAGSK